jgi:hypothetical protein
MHANWAEKTLSILPFPYHPGRTIETHFPNVACVRREALGRSVEGALRCFEVFLTSTIHVTWFSPFSTIHLLAHQIAFLFLGGPSSFSNSECHASKSINVADPARCKILEELGKADAQQSERT